MARNSNGDTKARIFPKYVTFFFFSRSMFSSDFLSSKQQPNTQWERVKQKATIRKWSVVAEVGVKTHTAMCQTHTCDLARLTWHEAPAEKERKSWQSNKAPYSMCFIQQVNEEAQGWDLGLLCLSQWRWSGFFSCGGELGGSAGTHTDLRVPPYSILGKRGSSQLILLPVVKQIIVLKQLCQTIASLMALFKCSRDRNHNIF